ncbi:MAG: type I 3-dehydroquinate dehydratase [Verrucomicrobiae bacterium]|nr:type I 3-dehydroquinate dehydratase [Verrucomicrobiae bacterium]
MRWTAIPKPCVVGTISRAVTLAKFHMPPEPVCHAVEVRLDKMLADASDWVVQTKAIEAQGLPVIVTVRLASEGGEWRRPDAERWGYFATALEHVAAVDVELQSRLVSQVAASARRLDKTVIVSAHDFVKTPSASALRDLILEALPHATIVKIATLTKTPQDIAVLRELVQQDWGRPLAVMGMGPLAAQSRRELLQAGSALAYGWLDSPAAPGQPSAAELMQIVSELSPAPRR